METLYLGNFKMKKMKNHNTGEVYDFTDIRDSQRDSLFCCLSSDGDLVSNNDIAEKYKTVKSNHKFVSLAFLQQFNFGGISYV